MVRLAVAVEPLDEDGVGDGAQVLGRVVCVLVRRALPRRAQHWLHSLY